MKRLLIDAISTNSGGAISHLKNILINFNNQKYFQKVDVFLPKKTSSLRIILAVFIADKKPCIVEIGRTQFNRSIATEEMWLGKTANFAMQRVP